MHAVVVVVFILSFIFAGYGRHVGGKSRETLVGTEYNERLRQREVNAPGIVGRLKRLTNDGCGENEDVDEKLHVENSKNPKVKELKEQIEEKLAENTKQEKEDKKKSDKDIEVDLKLKKGNKCEETEKAKDEKEKTKEEKEKTKEEKEKTTEEKDNKITEEKEKTTEEKEKTKEEKDNKTTEEKEKTKEEKDKTTEEN